MPPTACDFGLWRKCQNSAANMHSGICFWRSVFKRFLLVQKSLVIACGRYGVGLPRVWLFVGLSGMSVARLNIMVKAGQAEPSS